MLLRIVFILFIVSAGSLQAQTPLMQLEFVKADPNPYYEMGEQTGFIRINNLPYDTVTIQIAKLNGTVIRNLVSDDKGYLDWDLKNDHEKKVETGLYYVTVNYEGASRSFKIYLAMYPAKDSF